MAGGRIGWISARPHNGFCFPGKYVGAGGVAAREDMLKCAAAATLTGDTGWTLTFPMPLVLPSGTGKFEMISRCPVNTGVLRTDLEWKSVATNEDPSTGALNAEGVKSVTWGAGDSDKYKRTLFTLDADTLVAGELLLVDVVFKDASTTLASVSGHHFWTMWE